MNNSYLKNMLIEYDKSVFWKNKRQAERKTEFYKIHPELQKLDEKLTSLAISTSLSLINKNSREKLDELNNNIKKLKKKKK